jgi:hypothetical protein
MKVLSKSMLVRLLGQRLFKVFKFSAIKNPAQEAGFFMILNYLKKV